MTLTDFGKATAETKMVVQPGPIWDSTFGAQKRQ
jgi:hypothetical protein